MKTWLRWLLIVHTIGGGFCGFVITLQGMFQLEKADPVVLSLFCGFAALFVITVLSGLLFVDNPRCTVPLIVVTILQIPWISSPILTFGFTSGFRFVLGVLGENLLLSCQLGSECHIFFLQQRPWGLGINLFAVLILGLLLVYRLRTDKAQEPTPAIPPVLMGNEPESNQHPPTSSSSTCTARSY
jgi:hypothetical protein